MVSPTLTRLTRWRLSRSATSLRATGSSRSTSSSNRGSAPSSRDDWRTRVWRAWRSRASSATSASRRWPAPRRSWHRSPRRSDDLGRSRPQRARLRTAGRHRSARGARHVRGDGDVPAAERGVVPRGGLRRALAVAERARKDGRRVTATLSCAFGCPYEGEVDPGVVHDAAVRTAAGGIEEIVLADTIGVAGPSGVATLVTRVVRDVGAAAGVHLHDTRGTALACVLAALESGATWSTVGRRDRRLPFRPGRAGKCRDGGRRLPPRARRNLHRRRPRCADRHCAVALVGARPPAPWTCPAGRPLALMTWGKPCFRREPPSSASCTDHPPPGLPAGEPASGREAPPTGYPMALNHGRDALSR